MTTMKPTTIWLPPEEREEAKKKAKERGMSLSFLVRQYLRKLPFLRK